jgi:hypothetical protein
MERGTHRAAGFRLHRLDWLGVSRITQDVTRHGGRSDHRIGICQNQEGQEENDEAWKIDNESFADSYVLSSLGWRRARWSSNAFG